MKLLFWTFVIGALIWWIGKKKLGGGNDLTAHLAEQRALQSIGATATEANNSSTASWPLATIGQNPYMGIDIDPLNPGNPFQKPFTPIFAPGQPAYLLF